MPSTISPPKPVPKTPDLLHAWGAGDTGGLLAWLGAGVLFGLLSGWVVGFTLKKVALAAAFFLGVTFIIIQVMVFNHLMSVNWPAVATLVAGTARSISAHDAMWWRILLTNLPYGGSFTIGFIMGFRRG